MSSAVDKVFMRPKLTNTERVHLTTDSLDGKLDNDGPQDSRPPRRSPRTSQSPIDKNSGKVWEDDYNYSDNFESSDSEDEDENKQYNCYN